MSEGASRGWEKAGAAKAATATTIKDSENLIVAAFIVRQKVEERGQL
jgi:hypothetical protein